MKKRIPLIIALICILGLGITFTVNPKITDEIRLLLGSAIDNNTVKIGHVVMDSDIGKPTEEQWYDGGWNLLLRPKNPALAENSAKAFEEGIANDNIGKKFSDRNSAYESFKKTMKITKIEPSNTDDSAFITLCAIAGGCDKLNYSGNAPTNKTIRKVFAATGEYEVLKQNEYLTSDQYLRRGDILVNERGQTVMVLSNGKKYNHDPSRK